MALLDSIVEFTVSEQVSMSAWSKLVLDINAITQLSGDVRLALKNAEQEFKATYSKPLPAAYRSAKSVALKAHTAGVTMVTESGEVLGKTAVQTLCKTPPPVKDTVEQMSSYLRKAHAMLELAVSEGTSLTVLKGVVNATGFCLLEE